MISIYINKNVLFPETNKDGEKPNTTLDIKAAHIIRETIKNTFLEAKRYNIANSKITTKINIPKYNVEYPVTNLLIKSSA